MKSCLSKPQRLIHLFLVISGVLIADGLFQAADAQCGPNDKIYIPPEFLPPRTRITPEIIGEAARNPAVSPQQLQQAQEAYKAQVSPMEIPYKGGRVLISPQNPCHQFFIPN
jgi:hypothetical protein